MNNNQNKALWIFSNIKESVDMLPQSLRGKAWEMIINYAFGDENVEKNCKNNKILLVFRVVKPLLRLRGIAGSQGGKSNNPSGLAKNKEPNIAPNIGANITPNLLNNNNNNNNSNNNSNNKEKNKSEENLISYGQFKNVLLTNDFYTQLINTHGIEKVNYGIEKLDSWLDKEKQKNKRNQNHRGYFKVNSWVWDGAPESKMKRIDPPVSLDDLDFTR